MGMSALQPITPGNSLNPASPDPGAGPRHLAIKDGHLQHGRRLAARPWPLPAHWGLAACTGAAGCCNLLRPAHSRGHGLGHRGTILAWMPAAWPATWPAGRSAAALLLPLAAGAPQQAVALRLTLQLQQRVGRAVPLPSWQLRWCIC